MGRINSVYVLVRPIYVLAMCLENRQSFTGLVSSNLTLSAKLNKTASDPVPVSCVRYRARKTHEVCGAINHGFHTGNV